MGTPTVITSTLIWEKLDAIEKLLLQTKRKRRFEGLLLNDIAKDLRVTSNFIVKEWILTGKLPAIKIGGENRTRGGYRVSEENYIKFLEELIKAEDREEEQIIFIKSPEQIIKDFQREHGLLKEKKRKRN